eukprot:3744064-Alexandrium_andersonii.AAC.1
MAQPAQTRPRYSGPSTDVANLIAPYVTSVTWMKYECDPDPTSKRLPPLQMKELMRHTDMLRQFYKIQKNLSFTQTTMHAALCEVLARAPPALQPLKHNECPDWADTMARRIRHLCTHAQKGLQRANTASWAKELKAAIGVAPLGMSNSLHHDSGERGARN